MPFEDLSGVFVLQGCSCCARNVQKQIYTHGEVWRVNESGAVALDQLPDAVQFSVPSGRPDHHILARRDTGFDISNHAGGRGEIDDHIHFAQLLRGESFAARVLGSAGDNNVVSALARHFRHQRARLSAAEKQDVHELRNILTAKGQRKSANSARDYAYTSGSRSAKNVLCRRWITSGTSSSSITKVRLISDAP